VNPSQIDSVTRAKVVFERLYRSERRTQKFISRRRQRRGRKVRRRLLDVEPADFDFFSQSAEMRRRSRSFTKHAG
jgi:hypothetical protein